MPGYRIEDAGDMDESVNRLATPLPDSVLDRYFAVNPSEVDHRKRSESTPEPPHVARNESPASLA